MSSQQIPIRSASLRFIKLGRQGSWEGLREHRLSSSAAPAALTIATTQTPVQHAIPMLVQSARDSIISARCRSMRATFCGRLLP